MIFDYHDEGNCDLNTYYEDHSDLDYSSPLSLYDKTFEQPKKPKKMKFLVVILLLLLGLGCAGFYVWNVVFVGTITPVATNTTNPTKDTCLVTSLEVLEN